MDNEEGESDDEIEGFIKKTVDDASSSLGSNDPIQTSFSKARPSLLLFQYPNKY